MQSSSLNDDPTLQFSSKIRTFSRESNQIDDQFLICLAYIGKKLNLSLTLDYNIIYDVSLSQCFLPLCFLSLN